MALIELRRFYDRNEAFIAQAALENAGLGAMVRDNGYANMIFGTAIATGGYGLFVLDEDVAAAREILLQAVPPEPAALDWTSHPQSVSGLGMAAAGVASAIVGGSGGSLVIAAKRRDRLINYVVAALPIGAVVATFAGLWLVLRD